MLSGIATISHNNLGMRQSLSFLTELLLLSFLDTNIQKTGKIGTFIKYI